MSNMCNVVSHHMKVERLGIELQPLDCKFSALLYSYCMHTYACLLPTLCWDGQAELTTMASYVPKWFPPADGNPSCTNSAQHRATTFNNNNTHKLPLNQTSSGLY